MTQLFEGVRARLNNKDKECKSYTSWYHRAPSDMAVLIEALDLLVEELNEHSLDHQHNETCSDYRPLGDSYGYCSLCHTKVRLNEDDVRDCLDKIKALEEKTR
jgi:hypothetical protein